MTFMNSSVRGAMVDSPATYTSEHDYITYEAYGNRSYFARALPPVPKDCPTPLGVVGKAYIETLFFKKIDLQNR